jgi:hypothetical protein
MAAIIFIITPELDSEEVLGKSLPKVNSTVEIDPDEAFKPFPEK